MERALIEDTRNKPGMHRLKNEHFKACGVRVTRCKLGVGDYTFAPLCSVDSKRDIAELAANVQGTGHARFRSECQKAKDDGTLLVVLTENEFGVRSLSDLGRWVEPEDDWRKRSRGGRDGGAPRRIDGATLAKACETMHGRYGVLFMFCSPDDSGETILRVLVREETRHAIRIADGR